MSKKKIITIGGMFFLIIGIYIFLDRLHASPEVSEKDKNAALQELLGRAPILTGTQHANTWNTYNGKDISFQYPSWGHMYGASPSGNIIDSFSTGLLDEHIVITIQISQGSYVTLSDLPGFNLRKMQTDNYSPLELTLPAGCQGFIKTSDELEQSVFCLKQDKIASIVVTGSDKESNTYYLQKVISSLSF